METIKAIINYLRQQSTIVKIIAIVITALLSFLMLFSSCTSQVYQRLPDISDNKIGAEGVVSKEKRTSRETKWYFKPESQLNKSKVEEEE